jgi:hypothetical protein
MHVLSDRIPNEIIETQISLLGSKWTGVKRFGAEFEFPPYLGLGEQAAETDPVNSGLAVQRKAPRAGVGALGL